MMGCQRTPRPRPEPYWRLFNAQHPRGMGRRGIHRRHDSQPVTISIIFKPLCIRHPERYEGRGRFPSAGQAGFSMMTTSTPAAPTRVPRTYSVHPFSSAFLQSSTSSSGSSLSNSMNLCGFERKLRVTTSRTFQAIDPQVPTGCAAALRMDPNR